MKKKLKPIKPKRCKVCLHDFVPFSSLAKACSVTCSLELIRADNKTKAAKGFNRETRRLKNEIKTKSDWTKDCQQVFNKFIRLRDSDKPCVSCNRFHGGQYHAGHYKTVGSSPELRFDERNCHKQCAPCNDKLSGNIVNYRPILITRIGKEALQELEGPHPAKKYTIDELKELKKFYQSKVKELTVTLD